MSAFKKPTALKPALKMALYGPAGSGKTFTALMLGEGLARQSGKRVALIDTEQGSAFYGLQVPQRPVHPEAFEFDVLHTRSITEVLAALRDMDPATHGVVVIDSISHLWDACKQAYGGKTTRHGQIPLHAWSAIKKPYKELMHMLLSAPQHVILCGRQAIDYAEDAESGELKQCGYRVRAEGETGYEPDVLVRLESYKPNKRQSATVVAHVEKDRTGVLAGRSLEWPSFDSLAAPLLSLLSGKPIALPSDEETGLKDAEALAKQEDDRVRRSAELAAGYRTRIAGAVNLAELREVGVELTPAVKGQFVEKDLLLVRGLYGKRAAALKNTENSQVVTENT